MKDYKKDYIYTGFGLKSGLGTFDKDNTECAECGKAFTASDYIVSVGAGYVIGSAEDIRNGPVYHNVHKECDHYDE